MIFIIILFLWPCILSLFGVEVATLQKFKLLFRGLRLVVCLEVRRIVLPCVEIQFI